jgi:hypothetical protein
LLDDAFHPVGARDFCRLISEWLMSRGPWPISVTGTKDMPPMNNVNRENKREMSKNELHIRDKK